MGIGLRSRHRYTDGDKRRSGGDGNKPAEDRGEDLDGAREDVRANGDVARAEQHKLWVRRCGPVVEQDADVEYGGEQRDDVRLHDLRLPWSERRKRADARVRLIGRQRLAVFHGNRLEGEAGHSATYVDAVARCDDASDGGKIVPQLKDSCLA